jgi:prophage antirepressor-like protein
MRKVKEFLEEVFAEVRLWEADGQLWWRLKDVSAALNIKSPYQLREHLDENGIKYVLLKDGIKQPTLYVDEANLYRCLLHSRRDEIQPFKEALIDILLTAGPMRSIVYGPWDEEKDLQPWFKFEIINEKEVKTK